MSIFDKREQSFESKFAHDQEIEFKIRAKAFHMLGKWAAHKLNIHDKEKIQELTETILIQNILNLDKCLEAILEKFKENKIHISKKELINTFEEELKSARKAIVGKNKNEP